MKARLATRISFCLLFVVLPAVVATQTRLLRQPDISATRIVFAYGGDLWIVDREGGDARRLTSFPGVESDPRFSPDGRLIAFSGEYDGNTDVYLLPVSGGEPKRLTWHPGPDVCRGFTNDGGRVVFASGRTGAPVPYSKFWTVSVDGGAPEPMPMPRAWRGQFSPDGRKFAYEPIQSHETEWRNYRGGQDRPIWVLDLDSYALEKLPWAGSNDSHPVYVGDTIYFLSDLDYVVNVYAYEKGEIRQLTHFKDFDAKNLESGGGSLIVEQGGYLHRLEPETGLLTRVPITAKGDFPWARPHWEEVAEEIRAAGLSPTGKRALFEARGEIFTVPAEKGDVRNLTRSPGVADRAPAWSPDGKWISWFSDEGGEYGLVISDQTGRERRTIELEKPTFFYTPVWSPDSKYLGYGDADRNLWLIEVASGKAKRIDNEGFAHPLRTIYPEWSPDSKWIAYTKRLTNQYDAVWVYSVDSGERHPLTDGMSDSISPAWDESGKYLYFLGSTDFGLNVGWLDMTSYDRPITRAVYLAVLAADEPSPLLPESDDEAMEASHEKPDSKAKEKGKKGAKAKKSKESKAKESTDEDEETPVEVRIDFDGLDQRIVAIDVPARNYSGLVAGEKGVIFYGEAIPNEPGLTLHRYELEEREAEKVLAGTQSYALSADGQKLLYQAGDGWGIVDSGGEVAPGDGALDLAEMRTRVDPPAEWRQIFREAWRFQRDYFYVENVHGLDLDWVYDSYAPWVEQVRHRSDLTHLLDILGGETAVGHSFTGGGDEPDVDTVPVGLLGADLEPVDGRYRIAKIYTGENWNPELRAPLSGPGIDARAGDYLLAVDGIELTAEMNPYQSFDRTADRQTVLTLNGSPRREGSREVTVVPVASESALRSRDWVEGNRRKVDALSGGRLAYVWLPDTGQTGYEQFNRYYFAQQDKQGAVIDERFNGGGSIADYMIDLMSRTLMGYFSNPIGDRQPWTAPNGGIWGPKVMLINDAAGSGGDMLPYMFRLKGIGPLVGTRTWGGLVGIWDVPPLVDGGYITAPRGGFFDLDGKWAVENEGVAPDVEVEQLPAEVLAGRDPQLEKGVAVALDLLRTEKIERKSQPPDPVRVKRPN